MKTKQREWSFIVACLLLGVVAEISFFHGRIGVSYIIFATAFYTVLFARFRFSFEHRRIGLLLMAGIWVLTSSFLLFDSTVFYYLNILLIPLVVFFQIVLITSPARLNWGKLSFIRLVTGKLLDALEYLLNYVRYISKRFIRGQKQNKNRLLPQILIGVLVAIPVLIIIVPLLISADGRFQALIQQVFSFSGGENLAEFGFRLALIFLLALFFFCVFKVLGKRTKREIEIKPINKKLTWNAVIAATVLVIVNLVYLLFLTIQFNYLFSDDLYGNLTYADYARRGFFELVIVSFINLTILLTCIKRVMTDTLFMKKFMQSLYSVLVIASGVLLISAWQRLALYEETYGFTVARLLAHFFMLFLLVLFAYMLIRIWLENLPILHFYLISAFVFYTILNVINIEGMVVTNNIERYHETEKIDVHYLGFLGAEGITGLIYVYEDNPDYPELEAILESKKQQWENQETGWQGFNFARQEAKELLQSLDLNNGGGTG
jgi:hypothetical protein